MNILITGGTGFLGQHLLARLVEMQDAKQIFVLCRKQPKSVTFNFSAYQNKVKVFTQKDILNFTAVQRTFDPFSLLR